MDTDVVPDVFLKKFGQFGPFQKRVLVMFLFIFFPVIYQMSLPVFVAYEPPWLCTTNSTACLQPNATGREIFSTNTQPLSLYERRCSLNRSDWKFADYDLYEGPHTTIATEFDLVCERAIYGRLVNLVLFFGWVVGALVLGFISDKYGRRSVLFPSVALVIVLTFCISFIKDISLVIAVRFFVGVFEGGSFLTIFVMAAELVGPSKRAFSITLLWFYFALSIMVMGLKAFFIRDWRLLCIVSSASFIFVLIFWKFVPESVRWLLVTGKKDKALEILQKVAEVNKREMPEEELRVPYSPPNKGCLELFTTKRMAILTLIQCYAWFVNGLMYFGFLLMNAGTLDGRMYLNFVLTSVLEIPGSILVIYCSNRFGRKKTIVWCYVAGAITGVAVSFIPARTDNTGYIAGRFILGFLGRLFITITFNGFYVFSAELFPTVVRTSGLGLVVTASRIGAALVPHIIHWTRVNSVLPFAVMGAATILAAIGCWFLPETNKQPTREVLGDGDVEKNANVLLPEKEKAVEDDQTKEKTSPEKEKNDEDKEEKEDNLEKETSQLMAT